MELTQEEMDDTLKHVAENFWSDKNLDDLSETGTLGHIAAVDLSNLIRILNKGKTEVK